MTFVGFDLHERYITARALDASGAVIAESRQRSTAWPHVLAWPSTLPVRAKTDPIDARKLARCTSGR